MPQTDVALWGDADLKKLVRELTHMCSDLFASRYGRDQRQAQREAKRLVKEARAALKGHMLLYVPPGNGRRRLQQMFQNEAGVRILTALKREGVKPEDYVAWWNHHVLEHEVIRRVDEFEERQMLDQLLSRRASPTFAKAQVRCMRPLFGNPNGSVEDVGEHRPLPYELRDRVMAFLARTPKETLRSEAKRCFSVNAYIREQLKAGKL